MASSLPYHEPSIQTILIQSSFLLLLNAVNHVLDSAIYAGLVGQILVGIAWGMPGGKILDLPTQEVIVQLGYIGLILLVFEGGLSTSFSAFKANLVLSTCVAITGIAVPMGLSFVLTPLVGASPLQAFAAGAALCSTSLGTTFTLLGTSGLSSSRLGIVLSSAAMMDDVVGLIMVQVISNLGSSPSLDVVTVIRPIGVSLAFAILLPLLCRFVVLPVTELIAAKRRSNPTSLFSKIFQHEGTALCVHTGTLIATVTGATYAGSSGLLGAYIAGAMISWWDAEAPHPQVKHRIDETQGSEVRESEPSATVSLEMRGITNSSSNHNDAAAATETPPEEASMPVGSPSNGGAHIFEKYYQPSLNRVFKPLFFASIGFSIPISQMFTGSVVWRGLVYTIFMTIGKLVCGLWLIRLTNPFTKFQSLARSLQSRFTRQQQGGNTSTQRSRARTTQSKSPKEKPLSLYPGLILGAAMVSRGEIGYLISSLAEGGGVFANSSTKRAATSAGEPSEIFLIVTWAITLCTIAGPVTMGLMVDRVRKLESKASGRRANVLGAWGVS